MTTFHESQPQSRRVARQHEREIGVEPVEFPGKQPEALQSYSTADPLAGTWDALRHAATQPQPDSENIQGRRSAVLAPAELPVSLVEPLAYRSQQDVAVPSYSGVPSTAVFSAPPPEAAQPKLTRRERRALESQGPSGVVSETDVSGLAYSESGGVEPAVPSRAAPPELIHPSSGGSVPVDFQTIVGLTLPHESVSSPETRIPPGSFAEVLADDAAAVDEVTFPEPAVTPFDQLFQIPTEPPRTAPAILTDPARDPVVSSPAASAPVAPSPVASAPVTSPDFSGLSSHDEIARHAPLGDESLDRSTETLAPVVPAEPPSWVAPPGHWSAQEEISHSPVSENAISRTIASGISTTNALVLPLAPEGADIRGPLTSAGEIMLTGSIDLPRALASTGQSDRFDGDNMDALYDLSDAEIISTDSSPVRAIRAVSTHTSGHGVTHTKKPKGTRALTGLLIAASSLAVVVAGLLVAAFAFNVL
ncbi:MAG: hypothetical protein ACRCSP_05990 [Rhodoglobus sp.]